MLWLKLLLSPGSPVSVWKGKYIAWSLDPTCVLPCWHLEELGGSTKGGNIFLFSLPLLDLGALSAARESWEYDAGARDLQSPDLQSQLALQKLLEYGRSSLHQQAAALHKLLTQSSHFGSSVGGNYLELANTVSAFWFTGHSCRPVCIPIQIF